MIRILSAFLFVLILNTVQSQTLIIGGANGNGDFENGSTGWTLVNGSQTNKWVVGANATPGATGNAIYISSSPSAPYAHQYDVTAPAYSYFYRDIAVPLGTKTFWISYDYISNGEATPDGSLFIARDALRIWGRSTTTIVTAGQELNNTFVDAGAGFYNQSTWRYRYSVPLNVSGFEGSNIRVIFQWFNNGSGGNQPPAAIDNIEVYASCQELSFMSADQNLTATSALMVWNTISGATGYELRFKKVSEPNTVPSYTNPITIAGGNSFSYNLTGLTPGTNYIAQIRPTGLTCTEYTLPTAFSTLTPPANDSCAGATTLTVEPTACEGIPASFYGTTPTALASSCNYGANNDVWFKFTATQTKHYIQTKATEYNSSFYAAKGITLFSGDCNNLTPVALPCATTAFSVPQYGDVTRLTATGLTPGTTYYVRVNTSSNSSYLNFKICVFNEIPAPSCATQIYPTTGTQINFGIPTTFRWSKATNAAGYRVRIIQQSGAYSEYHTTDTSVVYTAPFATNHTWTVEPFNAHDLSAICAPVAFTTCPGVASTITISAPNGNTKCAWDPILLTASSGTNIQWFLNNLPVPGATDDSLYAVTNGSYTVRVVNGSCYENPSNSIQVNNLPTPVRPNISPLNDTTVCQGNTITFSANFNINNQWFNGSTAIAGANAINYAASTSGNYYLRCMNSSTGCYSYSDTVAVNVIATTTPTITVTNGPAICNGDSARLKSSALVGNQWYKAGVVIAGATDTVYFAKTAGDYTVKTTIGTCISPASTATTITVNNIPATPAITLTGGSSFCAGDSAKLTSSAATGNQWYKNGTLIAGATGTIYYAKEAGSYTVKSTVNNCTSAASTATALTVNPQPAKPTITVNGFILTSSTGTSYQWYLNNSPISGATAATHTVLIAGNYKVEITDANGCKNISDNVNAITTGLNEVVLAGYTIALFPNPAPRDINIVVTPNGSVRKEFKVSVTDLSGKLLLEQKLRDGNNKIDISKLAAGAYMLSIKNGQGVKTVRIVKAG